MYLPGVGVCARFVMEKSTRMRDPSSSWPSRCSLASSASRLDSMLTKQNPLERPVPRSHTTLQLSTFPYFSNKSSTFRSEVWKFNPKTPRHLLEGGQSRSPTCRLRDDIGELLRERRDRDPERLRDRDLDLLRDGERRL